MLTSLGCPHAGPWRLLSAWKHLVNLCFWICIHGPKFSVVTYQVGIRKISPSWGFVPFIGCSFLVHFVEFQIMSKSIVRQNWEFSIKYYSLISLVGCQCIPSVEVHVCVNTYKGPVWFFGKLDNSLLDCSQSILLLQYRGHCFVAILTDFIWLSQSKFRH